MPPPTGKQQNIIPLDEQKRAGYRSPKKSYKNGRIPLKNTSHESDSKKFKKIKK